MTKRTPKDKLTIYRRHAGSCKVTGALDKCECAIWIHGKLKGRPVRESLNTRSLATADLTRKNMLNGATHTAPEKTATVATVDGMVTLAYAAEKFIASKSAKAQNTLKLYTDAVSHFREWCEAQGIETLASLKRIHIQDYFAEYGGAWKTSTAAGKLTFIRVYLNYCVDNEWLAKSPASSRSLSFGKTSKSDATRLPFTPDEITKILAVADSKGPTVYALVLLMLYTGMRISDATFCERAAVTADNRLDYRIIKTRQRISCAPELQPVLLDALKALPKSRVYFFQPDREGDYAEARRALREGKAAKKQFSELMPDYDARVRETTELIVEVLREAGLTGACHRFRDTFAINLLTAGADIVTVCDMLGHSDIKITKDHYLKAVPGYGETMSQKTRLLNYQFPRKG